VKMSILMQTINFTAALLRKTGQVASDQWDRKPAPLNLNPDLELVDTIEDPIKLLSIRNSVLSPSLMPNGKPWHGAREKPSIFFQVLIEACSSEGSIVADLTASTGASLKAYQASGRHFFGLEKDP
jgi:DNA modification methylase